MKSHLTNVTTFYDPTHTKITRSKDKFTWLKNCRQAYFVFLQDITFLRRNYSWYIYYLLLN